MNGLEQMLKQLIAAEAALIAGANDGVHKGGEHILGVSNQHVPHEEGTLERSGRVTTESTVERHTAAISYGGGVSVSTAGTGQQSVGAPSYAVVQHEDMTLKHDPGRTSKYLENAMNSERTVVGEIVAESTRTMLARATRRR